MVGKDKDNYISIARAICIIFMVMGHSGCPLALHYFLYIFHMPFFFLCSGYFFKGTDRADRLRAFCVKKVRGLYVPYMEWSLLFILLHNVFFRLQIYNELSGSYLYTWKDFGIWTLKAATMTDYELLIRPLWFMKGLLLSALLVAVMSFLLRRCQAVWRYAGMLALLLAATVGCKYAGVSVPLVGEVSTLTMSASYFCAGILYRVVEQRLPRRLPALLAAFVLVAVASTMLHDEMRTTTYLNCVPYFVASMVGIYMVLGFSARLTGRGALSRMLYYIGQHTMPILALNLLCLKLGNLIKLAMLGLPLSRLADYTIIYRDNEWFWVVYVLIGTAGPLLLNAGYRYMSSMIRRATAASRH